MSTIARDKWTALRERSLASQAAREQYEHTRSSTLSMRQLLQKIDAERERIGLSKSELARRIGTTPAVVRRLFTSPTANPTLRTMLDLFDALSLEVTLQPRENKKGMPTAQRSSTSEVERTR